MRSVTVALVLGLTLMAIAIVVVLAQSPITVAGTNSVAGTVDRELVKGNVSSCQAAGMLPQGTSAVRIAIEARAVGPMVTLKVFSGSHLLTQGSQAAGWGPAATVTVPVRHLAQAVNGARICMTIGPTVEPFRFHGTLLHAPAAETGKLQDVALRMEYLRPGPHSWWSLGSSIAYHMGLGRAASGTWLALLALALMLAVGGLASLLTLRELR